MKLAGIFVMLIGAFGLFWGLSIFGAAQSAMHQIYAAVVLTGNLCAFGIGAAAYGTGEIVAELRRTRTKS